MCGVERECLLPALRINTGLRNLVCWGKNERHRLSSLVWAVNLVGARARAAAS